MKRCPACNRTYADETITFCLADGNLLSAPYDDPKARPVSPRASQAVTEVLSGSPIQADKASHPTLAAQQGASLPEVRHNTARPKRRVGLWITLIVALALLVAGVVAIPRYFGSLSDDALVAELVAMHEEFYAAHHRGDTSTVSRLLAEEYNGGLDAQGNPITQNTEGGPINKTSQLALVKADPNVDSDKISDAKLESRTDTTATITFMNTLKYKTGTPLIMINRVKGRYVKRDGRWLIVSSALAN